MSSGIVRDNRTRLLIVEDQGLVRTFFERWIDTLPRCVLAGGASSGTGSTNTTAAGGASPAATGC